MTIPMERVETRILSIRGHRVMLDNKAVMLRPIRHWRMIDYAVR